VSDGHGQRPAEPRIERALARLARAGWLHGPALDVACGDGRHAVLLGQLGLATLAIDRDSDALARLRRRAARLSIPVLTHLVDLESPSRPQLDRAAYGLIIVVNYLHRPLCHAIAQALQPGGALVYETFTRDQALIGRPKNPAYLLRRGELLRLFAGLTVIDHEEGGSAVSGYKATLVARRPP